MNRLIPYIAAMTFLPVASNAHHSTAVNFTQEIISVQGIIERVRYVNPHASVVIKNIDDDGEETFWLIETASRTTLDRQGISLDELEIGSTITATGRKGRWQYTMYLQKITFEDGSEFFPQQDRE